MQRVQGAQDSRVRVKCKRIKKGQLGTLKKGIVEIERILITLIKSLEKILEPWAPGILEPFFPTRSPQQATEIVD